MFKPRTLNEAISLARMKDDQLSRQKKLLRPQIISPSFLNSAIQKVVLGIDATTSCTWAMFQLH